MNKEEQYLADYQQTKRRLEEESDELRRFHRKSEKLLDETFSELQQIVQRFGETNEPLDSARKELANLESDFLEKLELEKKKLLLREEEAEKTYQKRIKELNNT